MCYLHTGDAQIIKDIYIKGLLEEQVEKVLDMKDARLNPPPPRHGEGGDRPRAPARPEAEGIHRFGKSAQAHGSGGGLPVCNREKAKDQVAQYLKWCDSDASPTTATSWKAVMMKWPSEYAPMFPEVAQAFR